MKKLLALSVMALCAMLSVTAFAVTGECTYYAQNGDHSWNQVDVKMPSCTDDGYFVLQCAECGETKQEITGEAYGHSWEKTDVVEATCTEAGYIVYTCQECGEQETEDVLPHGHYWMMTGTEEGTCTKPTYTNYICDNEGCSATKREKTAAPGHKWKDLYEIQSATCTTAGSMKTECKVCKEVGERIIEIIDHEYGEWIVTKSVDNGMCYRIRTCIMCGKENADEFYPEGTLYRNVKNEKQAVKDLQTMLTDCGYLNDKIDGVFGKKTEQAVKSFQADAGIKADGIAWPQTISRLNTEWELMMGFSATPAPVVTLIPKPVATATPGIVFETEEVYDRCSCIVNPDGSEEIVYCENHQTLVEMGEALMAAATTESLKTRALNQMKSLWTEEMNLLYDGWIAASGEADQETIINGRKMFEAYAEAQEALWKMQYRNNSAAVAEKVVELLVDQCVSLCGIAEVSEGANASTPKGYVGVSLVDGWYVGEPKANDAITFHNDGVGPNPSTWITITDTQTGAGIEQAKQIVMFAYVGGEFTEIEIGDNSFHYIANSDGTVFTLIAETSTGKAMKVDGRNCTLEQAMSLLETIVIY